MLVISCDEEQAVWIGDVRVLVFKARDGSVTLGIKAPANVPVVREELKERDASWTS